MLQELVLALAFALAPGAPTLQDAAIPKNPLRALVERAYALADEGKVDESLELLADALDAGVERLDDEYSLRGARLWVLSQAKRMDQTLREELVLIGRLNGNFEPDDRRLLLVRLDNVLTLYELGRLEEAREQGENLLEDVRRLRPDDERLLLKASQNLGVVLSETHELERARVLHEQALALLEKSFPPSHPEVLAALGNIAACMLRLGDRRGALLINERVLAGLESTLPPDSPHVLSALQNHAVLLRSDGAHEDCLALLERCSEQMGERGDSLNISYQKLQIDLANSLHMVGRTDEARALLEGVLADFAEFFEGGNQVEQTARFSLVGLELETDRPEEVQELLGPAFVDPTTLDTLPAIRRASYHLFRTVSLAQLGREDEARVAARALAVELERGVLEAARASTREAQERARFYRAHYEFLLTEDLIERAAIFSLVESARASGARGWIVGGVEAGRIAELRRAVAAARRRVHDLVATGAGDGAELEREITELTRERDGAERELASALASEAPVPRVDPEALARALRPGEAAIGLHVASRRSKPHSFKIPGEARLYALVLTRPGRIERLDLCSMVELEQAVGAWYETLGIAIERGRAIDAGTGAPERQRGAELRALVLDPLLAACGEERPERLWLCASGPLISLPLDALSLALPLDAHSLALPLDALSLEQPDAPDARVGDRLTIVSLPSFLPLLAPRAPAAGAEALVALGGVSYGEATGESPTRSAHFAPLLQTRLEVEAVRALWPADAPGPRILLGADATKSALEAAVPGARYLHVATHGWADGQGFGAWARGEEGLDSSSSARHATSWLAPLAWSGLALAGANSGVDGLGRKPGLLSAEELAGWDLSGCELAVLSACDSGIGQLDGAWFLQSLRAALHAAGARATLTSCWRVDDAATRRLMELFYGYLWTEGASKASALWRAKRDLRREGAPVRDWAGWILSGVGD